MCAIFNDLFYHITSSILILFARGVKWLFNEGIIDKLDESCFRVKD